MVPMHQTLTPAETDALLDDAYYGHLACKNGEELYLVPVTFVRSGDALYAYTQDGKKVEMMRKDPKVCLQTERIAPDGGWKSVIVWGTFREITDRGEAQKACVLLADEFAKINTPEHPLVSPLIREISRFDWEKNAPVVYKIVIEKTTGRSQTA